MIAGDTNQISPLSPRRASQNERAPYRAQFLFFTLFGDYIMPRGGTIRTADILHLAGLLGVSERATRVTLSRMRRKGWLISKKRGRRSEYSLTPRGWMLIKQGERRIFEPPFTDWDGVWQIVTFTLPEKTNRLRRIIRRQMNWLGFAPLSIDTWISPHDRRQEVKEMCTEAGIQEEVTIFSGVHLGPSRDVDLVQRCWDLQALRRQYEEILARYQSEYQECLAAQNGGPPLSPETCFVRRFWLMNDFQSFPLKDPNLPVELLPPDWPGFKVRRLFENYYRLLEPAANEFVDSVMQRETTP